jgi:tetratricopeptide (TPR) repeat protein
MTQGDAGLEIPEGTVREKRAFRNVTIVAWLLALASTVGSETPPRAASGPTSGPANEDSVAAAIDLAQVRTARGEYAEALEALDDARETGAVSANWLLARSEALSQVGRYEEASEAASLARRLRPGDPRAILSHGRLLETLGHKDEATDAYRSVNRLDPSGPGETSAADLVTMGRILDRYAVLTGQRASRQAANILHNYFQEAYQKADPSYWPAHVAAGEFLLDKHHAKEAAREFELALKLRPHLPAAEVGLGAIHLAQWDFEGCMKRIRAALGVNPRFAEALLLKATCLMQWRKYDQVEDVLRAILETNPNHLEALSLLAALHVRNGEEDLAQESIDRVERINESYAGLPMTIGHWLTAARRFPQAERHYLEAIQLAPELAEPLTSLGRLYMQTGDEDKARRALERAHAIDDFRSDVVNYLQVLRELEGFAVKETDHFILKASPDLDSVLLSRMAPYLERAYAEVCGDFRHEPADKTIVEIFPTHAGFSRRISGRAWIGTIGASTGRVIALVAPHAGRSQFGTYNWNSVLRHEFTHTVTLSATDNRIPHWLTEACAVWEQPDRQTYDAVRALVAATRDGRLFPIRELDWGFVRPKRRGDRGLAYAQAEWALEHIIASRGYPAILQMLDAFRNGKSQKEVFEEVLAQTEARFDSAFRTWAIQQVRRWGFDPEPVPDLRAAVAEAKRHPDSADALSALARAHLLRGRFKPAESGARRALAIDPMSLKAITVLAESLAHQKRWEQAIPAAQRLERLSPEGATAPRVLAQAYIERGQWADALIALEQLKRRRPLDPYSFRELADLYRQLGRPDLALPNLIELHRRTMEDSGYARQIAEIYGAAPDGSDKALTFWEEVTNINPYDSGAYRAMTEIHIIARRYEKAVQAAEDMQRAAPSSAESWTYLAIARYRLGRSTHQVATLRQAREAATQALKLDAETPKAREVIERVDAALAKEETHSEG